ncbi:MAG TPA: hypothetical protein VH257_15205 [Chloroflexota bacterium]|jgi:hypothetical protein|nr:hypothetical protein [Chloroflexota bacterium]
MTESWETESDAPEAQAGRIVSGLLRLANNEEAVRLLGVEGTLEEELDVTFLNDPLGWVANEIANGIKESDDEEEGVPLSTVVAMLRLYSIVQGGAVDERELREAVVEFLQEDAG